MKPSRFFFIFFVVLFFGFCDSQELCPKFLLEKDLMINIEGRFINEENTRVSIDVIWHHHTDKLDTFFISFPKLKSFRFITAGEYRYLEFDNPNIKRQLGLHHLRENIGDTPLKLDDLELLANGTFLCKDSLNKKNNSLATAFSNMWWSITFNKEMEPDSVIMKGAFKEVRLFRIGKWKDFSGNKLPTFIKLTNENYQGEIWIRSAYPIESLNQDPLTERYKDKSNLFRKAPREGKREIPLILKLNQEFLHN